MLHVFTTNKAVKWLIDPYMGSKKITGKKNSLYVVVVFTIIYDDLTSILKLRCLNYKRLPIKCLIALVTGKTQDE